AEDGIRDWSVTGVQTCALPIYALREFVEVRSSAPRTFLPAAFAPLNEVGRVCAPNEREARQPDIILGYAFQKIFGKRLQVLAKRSQTIALHVHQREYRPHG